MSENNIKQEIKAPVKILTEAEQKMEIATRNLTDGMVLDEIIKNPDMVKSTAQVAAKLGVTPETIKFHIKNLTISGAIEKEGKDYAKSYGINAVKDLIKQSNLGNVEATKILLEISGIYEPNKDYYNIELLTKEIEQKRGPGRPPREIKKIEEVRKE